MNEADLNILVSNVVSENRYKHCRLCLKEIQGNYVRFEDCVSFGDVEEELKPIGLLIKGLFGHKICDEIPGVDAICADCAERVLECNKFMESCKKSTELLNKVFDNLYEALDVTITSPNTNQCLYVIVGENESKLILLDKDIKKENVDVAHKCDICDNIFEELQDLETHTLTAHCNVLLTCAICQQTFTNQSDYNRHGKHGHKFQCPDCDQFRSTPESLKHHQDKAHTLYVCKECGKSYRGLDKLRLHEEKHNASHSCPKCGKTYLTKDFYMKHVKLCVADKLDRHPFRANTEKSYFCEKCGKGYSTSGGLRVHDRFVHGNAKPHVCEFCGKKFTAPSYLKIHMVKHTGEKNFTCSICSNKFVSKEALLYHVRRHTGEKPYSCQHCNETFVNASARAEHIKFKHTGPKLPCDICHRKFFTPNFLKHHMQRHHDPASKLYSERCKIPPNMPGKQNMRTNVEDMVIIEETS